MVMLTVPQKEKNVPFSNKRINMLKQPVSAFLNVSAVQLVDIKVYHSSLHAMVMLLMLPNQLKLTQTLTWLVLKSWSPRQPEIGMLTQNSLYHHQRNSKKDIGTRLPPMLLPMQTSSFGKRRLLITDVSLTCNVMLNIAVCCILTPTTEDAGSRLVIINP